METSTAAAAALMGGVDYAVFAFMLGVSAAIGVYYGFCAPASSADEYLMGGRSMKTFPIAMSLIASFVSGVTLLGMATEAYLYGIQFSYVCLGLIISSIVNALAFLPVFYDLHITSTYEYLDMRFGKSVRILGSFFFIINMVTWIPIVIYLPAIALNQVTGVDLRIISPVVCIVCIFYTCLGGIRAVVWTDVVQSLVMFGSVLVVVIKGTVDVGGLAVVWSRNVETGRIEPPLLDVDPRVRMALPSLLLGGLMQYLYNAGVNQIMVQRYLALPTLTKANIAVWIFTAGAASLILLSTYSGLLIFARYFDCDPLTTKVARAKDQLLPLMVAESLGGLPGMTGVFVAGIFSAALSSMSTALNSMAAVVFEDFFKTFFPRRQLSERQADILMKAVVVVLGSICTALVFVVDKLGSAVLQMSMSLSSMTNGPSLALFTAGMFFPWINTKGALAGGLTSVAVMSWLILGGQAYQASGDIRFATKPLSTDGCRYAFDRVHNGSVAVTVDYQNSDVWSGYRVSPMWYTMMGWTIMLVVSLLVSLVVPPGEEEARPGAKLFSPLVRRWLPVHPLEKGYKTVEMRIISTEEERRKLKDVD
ncbi:sodium-coupled monocarboxylate transporter 1-like [Schistocerca gregaria]|uniref:sodium-coupled monocarboxylate transporter 1-like n=1 Tax=Schistocerca gregaria TaxID=7010 RepID=UPI00211EE175|nr:sodium-coupled monocarboxylate transporter 1-like [Schistocerca gregaria]XP_049834468.1 sodium-coupled monocarboxylate transporter 1-like [Schistocerca gregaria]